MWIKVQLILLIVFMLNKTIVNGDSDDEPNSANSKVFTDSMAVESKIQIKRDSDSNGYAGYRLNSPQAYPYNYPTSYPVAANQPPINQYNQQPSPQTHTVQSPQEQNPYFVPSQQITYQNPPAQAYQPIQQPQAQPNPNLIYYYAPRPKLAVYSPQANPYFSQSPQNVALPRPFESPVPIPRPQQVAQPIAQEHKQFGPPVSPQALAVPILTNQYNGQAQLIPISHPYPYAFPASGYNENLFNNSSYLQNYFQSALAALQAPEPRYQPVAVKVPQTRYFAYTPQHQQPYYVHSTATPQPTQATSTTSAMYSNVNPTQTASHNDPTSGFKTVDHNMAESASSFVPVRVMKPSFFPMSKPYSPFMASYNPYRMSPIADLSFSPSILYPQVGRFPGYRRVPKLFLA